MGLVLRRKGLRPVGRRLGPLLSTPGRGAVAPGLPRLPSQAFPLLVPIRTHPALLDSLYAQWCCSSGFSAPLRSGSSKARVGGRGMEIQAEAVSRLFPPSARCPWVGRRDDGRGPLGKSRGVSGYSHSTRQSAGYHGDRTVTMQTRV